MMRNLKSSESPFGAERHRGDMGNPYFRAFGALSMDDVAWIRKSNLSRVDRKDVGGIVGGFAYNFPH
jgi:hypothetical protein